MTTATMKPMKLESSIAKAMAKVQVKKENELSRYFPEEGEAGVKKRMHHLSYQRLKKTDPNKVQEMLEKHIFDQENPEELSSPPRKVRGISRGKEQLRVSASLIKKVAARLEAAGDQELLAELEPMIKSDAQIVKELIAAIRRKEKAVDLWKSYLRRVAQS